ncbi:hypothetical protein E3T54_16365 [Cryobacterium sp. Sr8]|nr:hypothetical protein E3T54_16365 [Cryobacterium sp. Sr8]
MLAESLVSSGAGAGAGAGPGAAAVGAGSGPGAGPGAGAPADTLSTAIAHWAIHPGGRSILDKTEAKLGLTEAQLVPSRETLRQYGNMSSTTILFVMKAIMDAPTTEDGQRVCAMAFGPGLTVESGLMTVAVG